PYSVAVLLALTLETAKNIAIGVALGLILIAFLVAKFVRSVVTKAIAILVLGGAVLGVWTQRDRLSDCGKEVQTKYQNGDFSATKCSFFGAEVDVNLPGD
ncbi:MAG: hypothetical protein AB7J47_24860, partial [Acidimicrobiia bacterium]